MQSLGRNLPVPLRRDPAPSRLAYRLHRLWLTPAFRLGFRLGMPVLVVALIAALVLGDAGRRAALTARYVAVKDVFQDRPEFQVNLIAIRGAAPELADAVRSRMGIRLPISSWKLDLDAARAGAEALDAVESARLRITGAILEVEITERKPALVWRSPAGLSLIDATGHRVAGLAARADRADLPLVLGEGADAAAAEALEVLQAAAPLAPRIRGLLRQSERRWDLVLDRDQIVLLPAIDPVAGIERLLALDKAQQLLARDLAAVDLRDPRRPVLRLGAVALATLRGQPIVLPAEAEPLAAEGPDTAVTEPEPSPTDLSGTLEPETTP